MSGDHAKTLKEQTFTDAKKTNYLEAVKYVANLVWNGEIWGSSSLTSPSSPEYQTKQAHSP